MKTQINARYTVGRTVRLTPEAVEHYGKQYDGAGFRVTSVSKAYMPASEFYAKGSPAGFHPGFDGSAGCALYDLHGLNFSLYDYELI